MKFLLKRSARQIFLIITLICFASVIYAFYAQYIANYTPCPLCLVERIIITTIGIFALLATMHKPKTWLTRIEGILLLAISIFGIAIAIHHILLINLPADQQPLSCGMPLLVLYQKVPLLSFLSTVLKSDAECGIVTWQILGMPPPVAVLLLCCVIAILTIPLIFKKQQIIK